jgi:hypothetical protein
VISQLRVRPAEVADLERMADLASEKRAAQASWEPNFWRVAERARELHPLYLRFLLTQPDVVASVSLTSGGEVDGFAIARCGEACVIDDFNVARPELWSSAGRALLDDVLMGVRAHAARDLVIVCAERDLEKAAMLRTAGLAISCAFRFLQLRGVAHSVPDAVRPAGDADADAIAAIRARAKPLHHGMPVRDADLCLVHAPAGRVTGFTRAKLGIPAPPVYAPGGTLCFSLELSGGDDLLAALEARAAAAGDVGILLPCAASDTDLRARLDARGYRHPVDWYHQAIL